MKKIVFLMTILLVGMSQAQEKNTTRNPEQVAAIMSKRMTLQLDLDNKQQEQVEKLFLQVAKERNENKLTREQRAQLTNAQKAEKMEEMLDQRIAVKRGMKDILNATQYDYWVASMEDKKVDRKRKMLERRSQKRNRKK